MKAVLLSVKPKWCELIASGKKTIEVRKSAPKEVPFKVYIYQTKKRWICKLLPWLKERQAKVIGEFICYKVVKYESDIIMCAKWETNGGEVKENLRYNAGACLSAEEMFVYSNGKPLYGWHITNRKIYDEPKELGEFWTVKCTNKTGRCGECKIKPKCIRKLIRPPQSWQYVEGIDDVQRM